MVIELTDPTKHPIPQPALQPPMVYVYEKQGWEYKIIVKKPADEELPTEQELNKLGASGWELVGVVRLSDKVQFYLKRPASR
jgi:hypothetical protein